MKLAAVRIVGTLIGLAVGVLALHISVVGKWIGLFVMVGVLGELFSPIMRRNSIWHALAIFAMLFIVVYQALPTLATIGPHHWIPRVRL